MKILLRGFICCYCLIAFSAIPAKAAETKLTGQKVARAKLLCLGDFFDTGEKYFDRKHWSQSFKYNSGRQGLGTVKLAIPGLTTETGLKHIQDELPKQANVKMLVVNLGTNDVISCPVGKEDECVKKCADNVAEIIDFSRKTVPEITIVICAPPEGNSEKKQLAGTFGKLAKAYETLAKEKKTGFVSLVGKVSPENYHDGIHPNIKGQAEMYKQILKVVKNYQPKIVCLGDSITTGYKASGKGRWIALLQNKMNEKREGVSVLNWGAPGRTTEKALERMQNAYPNLHNVKMLIIFLGGNNISFRPAEQGDQIAEKCSKNVAKMIDIAREFNPDTPIVVCSPPEKNYKTLPEKLKKRNCLGPHSEFIFRKLGKAYEKMAKEKNVGFVSLIDTVDKGNYPDGIHPNTKGHAEMFPHIWKAVEKRLD